MYVCRWAVSSALGSVNQAHSDLLDLSWTGGNEPLRGRRWWERGASAGMKYGARWSGSFVMSRGHTGEGAPPVWNRENDSENVWTGVSALLHRGFSGRARCMTSAHGTVCVSMCQVCVWACMCWKAWKGGGVNTYYDDPDGVGVYVCVFQRWSALPAVVQKMRGQHRDEDVLPVHRKEQSSRTVDTCS